MLKVFISYRREDSIDVSSRIYDWLASRLPEDSVFIDVDSIQAGTDFREALAKTLDQTGVMLAVVGQKWLDVTDKSGRRRLDNPEDFVRIEIETAMQRRIPVVPILVQGAEMPSAHQLPESLAPFAYRNALLVRPNPDFTRDMERVTKAVESYVPDVVIAAAPIPGRSVSASRGAPLPSAQASSESGSQEAPPIVPVGAAVRSIRYPWMVRRLLYTHLFIGIGFVPVFLLVAVFVPQNIGDFYRNDRLGEWGLAIGIPFWAVALIITISMFSASFLKFGRRTRA